MTENAKLTPEVIAFIQAVLDELLAGDQLALTFRTTTGHFYTIGFVLVSEDIRECTECRKKVN